MSIVVSRSGSNARKLEKTSVESEDYLQRYVQENPGALPLDEYKQDINLLVAAREFPTATGPIDALGLDQDGGIYLIETKLYRNPDKRVVLAQVLDYGASLWTTYTDREEFVNQLNRSCQETLGSPLPERLEATFGAEQWSADEYLDRLRSNVSSGDFRFIVLMDRLTERLKDLITFINQNSRFDVFGVELEFYKHDDLEILIPRLFGAEVKKTVSSGRSGSRRRKWDEASFFEDAAAHLLPEQAEAIRKLYDWARQHGAKVSWGTGVHHGSFNPKFPHVCPKSVFTMYANGTMSLNFAWMDNPDHSVEYARSLAEALRSRLPAFGVPDDFMSSSVAVTAETWVPELETFTAILERTLLPGEQ